MNSVHFHPIVRVVEYDRDIAYRTVGRSYTRPLAIDYLDMFEHVDVHRVDMMTQIMLSSILDGEVYNDDLSALFFSTMFTSDAVCRETQTVLNAYGVRPASWSDYRWVEIKAIRSKDAIRRYKKLISKKYRVNLAYEHRTSLLLTGPRRPPGNCSL